MATLEAGCTAPVGALAEVVEGEDGPELWLRGALGQDDGVRRLSANGPVDDPVSLGRALANELLERNDTGTGHDDEPRRQAAGRGRGRRQT